VGDVDDFFGGQFATGVVIAECLLGPEDEVARALSVNEILMRAVVEAAAFLELSSDEVVHPDIAVEQLESIAYLLGQLSESDKRQLVAFTRAEADRISAGDYREFLLRFPEALCL
jgi:hypothetical protein